MNLIIVSMVFLFSTITSYCAVDLEYVRSNYEKAVQNKQLCETLINKLSSSNESNIHIAYLGALHTIWANHTLNPISKLSTFNKGIAKIDKAVEAEPNNVEIRFVRLSIQKNCPSFLGYNKNIDEDKLFIKNNIHTIQSQVLRDMCSKLI